MTDPETRLLSLLDEGYDVGEIWESRHEIKAMIERLKTEIEEWKTAGQNVVIDLSYRGSNAIFKLGQQLSEALDENARLKAELAEAAQRQGRSV